MTETCSPWRQDRRKWYEGRWKGYKWRHDGWWEKMKRVSSSMRRTIKDQPSVHNRNENEWISCMIISTTIYASGNFFFLLLLKRSHKNLFVPEPCSDTAAGAIYIFAKISQKVNVWILNKILSKFHYYFFLRSQSQIQHHIVVSFHLAERLLQRIVQL